MAKENIDELARMREQNPGHQEYEIPDQGSFIFRRPPRAAFNRFASEVADDKKDKITAMHKFVRACLVYPSAPEFEALLDAYPAFLIDIATDLQAVAGGEIPGLVKKGG